MVLNSWVDDRMVGERFSQERKNTFLPLPTLSLADFPNSFGNRGLLFVFLNKCVVPSFITKVQEEMRLPLDKLTSQAHICSIKEKAKQYKTKTQPHTIK